MGGDSGRFVEEIYTEEDEAPTPRQTRAHGCFYNALGVGLMLLSAALVVGVAWRLIVG